MQQSVTPLAAHGISDAFATALHQSGYEISELYPDAAIFRVANQEDYEKLEMFLSENPTVPVLTITTPEWNKEIDPMWVDAHFIPDQIGCEAEAIQRLESILRRHKKYRRHGNLIEVGKGYLLNPSEKKLICPDGSELELTPTELYLLLVLMQHYGEAVDSDTLIDRVWRGAEEGNPNSLRVHMHRLRRKLGWKKRQSDGLIETVRGTGYRLQ